MGGGSQGIGAIVLPPMRSRWTAMLERRPCWPTAEAAATGSHLALVRLPLSCGKRLGLQILHVTRCQPNCAVHACCLASGDGWQSVLRTPTIKNCQRGMVTALSLNEEPLDVSPLGTLLNTYWRPPLMMASQPRALRAACKACRLGLTMPCLSHVATIANPAYTRGMHSKLQAHDPDEWTPRCGMMLVFLQLPRLAVAVILQ
jgi:hypothetical protein